MRIPALSDPVAALWWSSRRGLSRHASSVGAIVAMAPVASR